MATVILGMHRSGTSLVARLLNLAGLYLGRDEEMVPAGAHNQRGFWEHQRLMEINEEILRTFGGSWDCPPMLRPCWQKAPELEPLREKAKAILAESFADQTHWGWKDPRTILTLPFWREVIDEPLQAVVCVRSPLDVAASLWPASRISQNQALALWQLYTERALLTTRPNERVIVFYEDFFQDCAGSLAPVLERIGLRPLTPGSERADAVTGFVDAGLRHHRATSEDLRNRRDVPEETRELYELLRAGSPAAQAFAAYPERDRLFQVQCRLARLEGENRLMRTMLDSPPHKLIHRFAGPLRHLGPLHRLTTLMLRAAAGTH